MLVLILAGLNFIGQEAFEAAKRRKAETLRPGMLYSDASTALGPLKESKMIRPDVVEHTFKNGWVIVTDKGVITSVKKP